MIYLLEDDNSIRELVVYTLNSTGLEAQGFDRPSKFRRAVENNPPSLAILDIMLPEESGLDILKWLRNSAATRTLPVMMLTAKGNEYDKVLGFESGADDYLAKPFGMMELVARVKALLRRIPSDEGEPNKEYAVGDLRINTKKHTVRVQDCEVLLTLKEFELLCLLAENQGLVFSRNKLLNSVWGYDFNGESRTVDVHIRTLRQKLGPCGDYIETVRGVGYRMGVGMND